MLHSNSGGAKCFEKRMAHVLLLVGLLDVESLGDDEIAAAYEDEVGRLGVTFSSVNGLRDSGVEVAVESQALPDFVEFGGGSGASHVGLREIVASVAGEEGENLFRLLVVAHAPHDMEVEVFRELLFELLGEDFDAMGVVTGVDNHVGA